jgi:hypothetical protein
MHITTLSGINVHRQKHLQRGASLAKPNYQFEKRQKDIAKKKKNEEKRQRKLDKKNIQSSENPEQSPDEKTRDPEQA